MHPVIEASLSDPSQTAARPRFPDFLCVGAQKCGTTWLSRNLERHSQIWIPPMKELQFFNGIWIPGHRNWTSAHRQKQAAVRLMGYLETIFEASQLDMKHVRLLAKLSEPRPSDEWYEEIFAHADPNQICGEFTPEYSLLPRAALTEIYQRNPNIRILFLIRNPVARAWSHLRMMAKVSGGNLDFARVARYPDVLQRSLFVNIYDRLKSVFPEENIWISSQEEIEGDPRMVLTSVCAHLGLAVETGVLQQAFTPVHVGKAQEPTAEVENYLRHHLLDLYIPEEHRLSGYYKSWR
ncbi:sulfotransferase [Rhodovibrionaceae bacterium A322]